MRWLLLAYLWYTLMQACHIRWLLQPLLCLDKMACQMMWLDRMNIASSNRLKGQRQPLTQHTTSHNVHFHITMP